MKKAIVLLLSILLAFGAFAGCAAEKSAEAPAPGQSEENVPDENPDGEPDDGEEKPSDGGQDTKEEEDPGKVEREPYTKVIILAGQSNAYGCSYANFLEEKLPFERYTALTESFEKVHVFPDADLNDCTAESVDDFKTFSLLSYPAEESSDTTYYRFGPEIGMAETLSQAFPDEDIYIIKVAKGGTSLYEDWRSPSRTEGISYLYYLFVQAIRSGLNVLSEAGLNPKIAGICWMQGEADAEKRWSETDGFAYADKWSNAYAGNLETFVNDLREAFNEYALDGEAINFIDAYINDGINPLNNSVQWPNHETVNGAKAAFAQRDIHNFVLNTLAEDLVVEGKKGLRTDTEYTSITPVDPLHYDSTSMLKLGNMFGEQIAAICKNQ